MLKITGKNEYEVEKAENGFILNGSVREAEIIDQGNNRYLIKTPSRVIPMELIQIEGKEYSIKVGHRIYPLQVSDELDQLIQSMGLKSSAQSALETLKAPMPGLIVDIRVKQGQQVKKGDILLILEAMKMENVIKATHDGEVKEILVEEKQGVEKNQILLRF